MFNNVTYYIIYAKNALQIIYKNKGPSSQQLFHKS